MPSSTPPENRTPISQVLPPYFLPPHSRNTLLFSPPPRHMNTYFSTCPTVVPSTSQPASSTLTLVRSFLNLFHQAPSVSNPAFSTLAGKSIRMCRPSLSIIHPCKYLILSFPHIYYIFLIHPDDRTPISQLVTHPILLPSVILPS